MSVRVRNSLIRKSLSFEILENRRLLAGNVVASLNGNTLTIRGDALDNSIAISQIAPNQLQVAGIATTINGKFSPALFQTNLANLDVDMRAGNDQVGLSNSVDDLLALATEFGGGDPAQLSGDPSAVIGLSGNATIRMGDGNDALGIIASVRGNTFVDFGRGNDAMAIEGSNLRGALTIEGGDGNELLRVRDSEIGGAVVVNAGAGDDTVNIEGVTARAIIINGLAGNDQISVGFSEVRDNLIFNGHGGDDFIYVYESKVGLSILVNLDRGNDGASLENVDVTRDVRATLGQGDDFFALAAFQGQTKVGGELFVDAGAGNDSIVVVAEDDNGNGGGDGDDGDEFEPASNNAMISVGIGGAATLIGGEGADLIGTSTANFARNLTIVAGLGNDTVEMDSTSIGQTLTVLMGAGDDFLSIANTTAKRAELFGGSGRDTSRLAKNSFGRVNRREFEFEDTV